MYFVRVENFICFLMVYLLQKVLDDQVGEVESSSHIMVAPMELTLGRHQRQDHHYVLMSPHDKQVQIQIVCNGSQNNLIVLEIRKERLLILKLVPDCFAFYHFLLLNLDSPGQLTLYPVMASFIIN